MRRREKSVDFSGGGMAETEPAGGGTPVRRTELSVKKKGRQNKVIVEQSAPEGLPAGWIKELKKKMVNGRLRRDPYYTDPKTGYIFRSFKDALRYVETGDIGRYAFKPKESAQGEVDAKDEKNHSPTENAEEKPEEKEIDEKGKGGDLELHEPKEVEKINRYVRSRKRKGSSVDEKASDNNMGSPVRNSFTSLAVPVDESAEKTVAAKRSKRSKKVMSNESTPSPRSMEKRVTRSQSREKKDDDNNLKGKRKTASDDSEQQARKNDENRENATDDSKCQAKEDDENRKNATDDSKRQAEKDGENRENATDDSKSHVMKDDENRENATDNSKRQTKKDQKNRKNATEDSKRQAEKDGENKENATDNSKRQTKKDQKNRENATEDSKRQAEKDGENRENATDNSKRQTKKDHKNRKNATDDTKRPAEKDDENRENGNDDSKRQAKKDDENRENATDDSKRQAEKDDENKKADDLIGDIRLASIELEGTRETETRMRTTGTKRRGRPRKTETPSGSASISKTPNEEGCKGFGDGRLASIEPEATPETETKMRTTGTKRRGRPRKAETPSGSASISQSTVKTPDEEGCIGFGDRRVASIELEATPETETRTRTTGTKRRGRPRKAETPSGSASISQSTVKTPVEEGCKGFGDGRLASIELEATPETETRTRMTETKRRGRPRKAETPSGSASIRRKTETKRRGRPRKAETPSGSASIRRKTVKTPDEEGCKGFGKTPDEEGCRGFGMTETPISSIQLSEKVVAGRCQGKSAPSSTRRGRPRKTETPSIPTHTNQIAIRESEQAMARRYEESAAENRIFESSWQKTEMPSASKEVGSGKSEGLSALDTSHILGNDVISGMPSLELPFEDMWKDPCIAFAIRTLTAESLEPPPIVEEVTRIPTRVNPAVALPGKNLGFAVSQTPMRVNPGAAVPGNNMGFAVSQTPMRVNPGAAVPGNNLGFAVSQTPMRVNPGAAVPGNNLGFAVSQTPMRVNPGAAVQGNNLGFAAFARKNRTDEKPGSSHGLTGSDLFKDPCIEFAFKTLTGSVPAGFDQTNTWMNSQQKPVMSSPLPPQAPVSHLSQSGQILQQHNFKTWPKGSV